jgi:hypothetical protein
LISSFQRRAGRGGKMDREEEAHRVKNVFTIHIIRTPSIKLPGNVYSWNYNTFHHSLI